jgi:hypothetical protein
VSIKPRAYTDGRDRISVRVTHHIDRDRFGNTLAQAYPIVHADGVEVKPLTQAYAMHLIRRQLAVEGHFIGDHFVEDEWVDWAIRETDRLWPQ